MANGVDPNQMLHSAASDLSLYHHSGLSVQILRVIAVLSYLQMQLDGHELMFSLSFNII